MFLLHNNLMPNIAEQCEKALYFCVTSMGYDGTFSTQNKITSKFQASLKAPKMDVLLNYY